jgi:PAS domain-containing protein
MSHPRDAAPDEPDLRQRAVAHLRVAGRADLGRTGTSEAMAVLHQLASSPATAGDALALLHELQVHQVELDLQQEELRNSRCELEAELIRQTALVERAPVGYMTLDAASALCEINLAGARLLGAAREDLLGRPLAAQLTADGTGQLRDLLARARDGLAPESCPLQLCVAGAVRTLLAAVDRDTLPGRFLLVLMEPAPPGPAAIA